MCTGSSSTLQRMSASSHRCRKQDMATSTASASGLHRNEYRHTSSLVCACLLMGIRLPCVAHSWDQTKGSQIKDYNEQIILTDKANIILYNIDLVWGTSCPQFDVMGETFACWSQLIDSMHVQSSPLWQKITSHTRRHCQYLHLKNVKTDTLRTENLCSKRHMVFFI